MTTTLTEIPKRFKKAYKYTEDRLVTELLQLVDDINDPLDTLQAYLNTNDAALAILQNRAAGTITKTANYTLLPTDDGTIFNANDVGGSFTMTLPDTTNPALPSGFVAFIRKTSSNLATKVTVARQGLDSITILGGFSTSIDLVVPDEGLKLRWTGIPNAAGNWRVETWDQPTFRTTWTPHLLFGGLNTGAVETANNGVIRRSRNNIAIDCDLSWTTKPTSVGNATIGTFPISVGPGVNSTGSSLGVTAGFVAGSTLLVVDVLNSSFRLFKANGTTGLNGIMTDADWGAAGTIRCSANANMNP